MLHASITGEFPGWSEMRADARRNRDALIAAAREVFTELGPDAPLDEIARRAGIGNATMYRHFPARRDLHVAVYADEVAALCARAEDLRGADGLYAWLNDFIGHVADKRDLAAALTDEAEGAAWHAAIRDALAGLLERAGSSVDPIDLLVMATGIALTGAGEERRARLLALLRHGTESAA